MGIWHIRDHLFGYLDHKTLETCRQVSDFWNESLEKLSLVKFISEFGNIDVGKAGKKVIWVEDSDDEDSNEKVCAHIPGWGQALQKYQKKASIDDLREIRDALQQRLLMKDGNCREYPVHIVFPLELS